MYRNIKIILCLLYVFIFFPQSAPCEESSPTSLLVTMLQSPQVLSSKEEISKLVQFAVKADAKNLYIQVYRANQSWFPSSLADQTPYEVCAKKVGSDPFALLIKESHQKQGGFVSFFGVK